MNFNTKVIIEPNVKITASGVNVKINQESYLIQEIAKFKSLYITAKSGYISFYAMKLLAMQNITISFRNINGKLIYDLLPKFYDNNIPGIRIGQIKAFLKNRDDIARFIINQKHSKYNQLLIENELRPINPDLKEHLYAQKYWKLFRQLITDCGYDYTDRRGKYGQLALKATNKINALLNFYYGLIEHRLLREIAYKGLDYQISFLHEPTTHKLSLSYDLIEYLRADIDNVVLKMAKDNKIKDSHFTVNEDYYLLKDKALPSYLKAIKPVEQEIPKTVDSFTDMILSLGQ